MSTPFKVRVYETLIQKFDKRYQAVSTRTIALHLGAPRKRTQRALVALEASGVVSRKDQRKGWKPALMAAATYRVLCRHYACIHRYVKSNHIALALNKDDGWVRKYLRVLESAGLICRLDYKRGWMPVRSAPPTAREQLWDTIESLDLITTAIVSDSLGITDRYARALLAQCEQHTRLHRLSPRGGWVHAA